MGGTYSSIFNIKSDQQTELVSEIGGMGSLALQIFCTARNDVALPVQVSPELVYEIDSSPLRSEFIVGRRIFSGSKVS